MVPPAKILLVGDSLTQQGCQRGGWVSDLAERYVRRADVLNRGFSGYNTRWILACMDRVTEGIDRACFATVWLGANDAALADGPASSQHVPVKEYRRSLRDIVEHVRRVADHVILMTPPPVDDSVRADQMHERGLGRSPDRTDMATAVYAKACAQVAAEVGVPLADVRDAMLRREDWRTLLTDGLHLTAGGCEVVLGALLATVEGELPRECHADGMPMHMEDWRVHAGVDQ